MFSASGICKAQAPLGPLAAPLCTTPFHFTLSKPKAPATPVTGPGCVSQDPAMRQRIVCIIRTVRCAHFAARMHHGYLPASAMPLTPAHAATSAFLLCVCPILMLPSNLQVHPASARRPCAAWLCVCGRHPAGPAARGGRGDRRRKGRGPCQP